MTFFLHIEKIIRLENTNKDIVDSSLLYTNKKFFLKKTKKHQYTKKEQATFTSHLPQQLSNIKTTMFIQLLIAREYKILRVS